MTALVSAWKSTQLITQPVEVGSDSIRNWTGEGVVIVQIQGKLIRFQIYHRREFRMPPSISSESEGSWARILALRSLSTSSSTWGSIDWRSSATIEQSPFQMADTRFFPVNLTRGGGAFFGSPNMHLITYLTWGFSREANKDTANGTIIEAGNVERGHVPRSGTGTGTFREQFSVKNLHKRCSSFRERSGSGNGNGNMATKGTIWMAVSYHRTSSRPNIKYSPCQVYALFAVILNLKLPLPESNNRIRFKSERGKNN